MRICHFKRWFSAALAGILAAFLLAEPFFGIVAENSNAWQSVLGAEPFSAQAAGTFRRQVSNTQPMWIVHIDSWNYADPAKIIDLIPEDVLPYVVFNISLSINWDSTNHRWLMVQDGYECAKSWLRTCAEKGVWTMIQPSSGGQSHFPDYNADTDYENTIYGEFFREYPNFIGYNYCEQFWGFESADFPITCKQRYQHFAALLELCNRYGGYLDVSWCANQWSAGINPIAMLKQVPEWEEACRKYRDNFILEEKYTQASYIEDVESEVYGAFISGYCGNFGVRYDETGWTDSTWSGSGISTKDQYRLGTGMPIHTERMALNGATVIDGPELVWADDFKETWGTTDSDGYHVREWAMYDQYQNTVIDIFRKVQDGTIRIPSRAEAIERTKVVVIQDVNSGSNDDKYSTYPTLFEGLYRMDSDGNLKDNHNLYKSNGRYQTIPTVYALTDDLAKSIPVQVKQSEISSRWSTIAAKQEEFNKLYPSEYWGNCYAGRNENTWVTYNPNKDGTAAGGYLSLQYNSCKELECTYSAYTTGIIREYTDAVDIYVNNYDEEDAKTLKINTFKIYGCAAEPTLTYTDRGVNQTASEVTTAYADGTYTITVKQNGPVDISVQCSGAETDRQTVYQKAAYTAPAFPEFYTGTRQYEGEFFDTKNIEENVTNGCSSGITGYRGQGFLKFGAKANAAAKDTVTTKKAGTFELTLRYAATADVPNVDLYVNGKKIKTLSLKKGDSYSDWKTVTEKIALAEGENNIEFRANAALPCSLYLDCFTVDGDFGSSTPVLQPLNGKYIQNLTVLDSENGADWSIYEDFGTGVALFGDRDFTVTSLPNNLKGAEAVRTACDSKSVLTDLATCTAGENITMYVAVDTRVTENLPVWLNSWKDTQTFLKTSNALTMQIYKQNFRKGESITLGTNGGSGNAVNYIVLAAAQEKICKGDVNQDGTINGMDLAAARAEKTVGFHDTRSFDAADVNETDTLDSADLKQLQSYLLGEIHAFSAEPQNITGEAYMQNIQKQVVEFAPENATAEQAGVTYGTFEKKTYDSKICGRKKNVNVLLPAGYTTNKKYPVLYVLHGYWGNEDALLDAGDASLRLRQIIGNAIAAGEAKDMIVVFPDIYASTTQDKCTGLDAKNNAAYDNFINVLTKELMPYIQQNYSVLTGRENTAITGFSMGGRESLNIGFSRPDLFGYVGAMCPAPGLTTDLIPEEQLKFDGASPYLLFVSAGSDDQVVWSSPAGYHEAMIKNGTRHIWHTVSGGDHGGKTIRPHMYNYIRAIFQN